MDYPNLNPYLTVDDTPKAIAFYKSAFDATERYRLTDPTSGKIGHAELEIEGMVLMLSEANPAWGTQSPHSLGGTSCKLNLMVADADTTFARAVRAGALATMPPTDMFYGYRNGSILDPFGHEWMIQHKIKDVSPAEMQAGWELMLAGCS